MLVLALAQRAEAEGCLAAGLCCTGRESSCMSRGWRTDRSYGDCYCDQACKTMLDCCYDYDQACPAVPCVVSEWSAWSGCSEPCRATIRVRQRRVLQEPQNGVPALITTGGYGGARKKREISDRSDVLGYCVEFELTSLTAACQHSIGPHTRWMQYLREGHQVCVECQPPALGSGQKHCSGDGEDVEQDRGSYWCPVIIYPMQLEYSHTVPADCAYDKTIAVSREEETLQDLTGSLLSWLPGLRQMSLK
ncbi:hypothetical protein NFI96_000917 [Prochilodus magdalenae]|nr:hypothetical protein NFI96_000917 [Prochilodus magdalenae]